MESFFGGVRWSTFHRTLATLRGRFLTVCGWLFGAILAAVELDIGGQM